MVSHESDGAVRSFSDDGNPEVMVTSSAASVFSGRKGVAVGKLAGATGLEPAAPCVTGRRSNQLNYAPAWDNSFTLLLCCPMPSGSSATRGA